MVVLKDDEDADGAKVYGVPIRNLGKFKIAWGCDVTLLHLAADGSIRSADNSERLLIVIGDDTERSREFSRALHRVVMYDEARRHAGD